jgi:hypothetical protein
MPRYFIALLVAAALMFVLPVSGAAQVVSIYGTFSPIHISNAVTGNTTGLNSTYTTGSYWSEGIGGGVTLTAIHLGPASLGLDIRGSKAWQKQSADTILVGVKLGVNPPILPIKPYVQVSGGYVGSRATLVNAAAGIAGTSPNSGFWAYEVLGGLDYKFLPHLDLRLIEIGGGQGYYRSGASGNPPNLALLTINSGVVLHF